ncbi:MAG: FkbM family methyltransferase, partial [bacterium]|nr:FkbM family methyltransferase [bacterium]
IIFENAAIDSADGVRTFYRLKENDDQNVPEWYDLLGSFSKEAVLRQRDRIPNFDEYLISEEIRCLSLSSLLQKHGIAKVDLLHIDAEGHDYEIIKSIPFASVKPAMILYEHRLLSAEDVVACQAFLRKQGYTLIQSSEHNTFAFLWKTLLRNTLRAVFS